MKHFSTDHLNGSFLKKQELETVLLLILLSVLSIVHNSCRKKELALLTSPPALPVVNTPPTVSAGENIVLLFPLDSAILNGYAYDIDNNIATYKWRQLSGPNHATMQAPDSLQTKISRLEMGEYNVELTVMDKMNAASRDTMKLTVLPDLLTVGSSVMQKFDSLLLGDSCAIIISGVSPVILANSNGKVFLQRYYAGGFMAGPYFPPSGWVQIQTVPSSWYWYEI